MGWSLSAGGSISRVINIEADEWGSNENPGVYNPFLRGGYYFTHKEYDIDDWNSLDKIKYFAEHSLSAGSGTPRWDIMPDEFQFNFLGYSGTFFMNHKGEWVVKSEQKIKVVFDESNGGFANKSQLRDGLHTNDSDMSFYFNKFTLITDDGTQYEFGGVNATEYSTPFKHYGPIAPVTWNLVKITTTDGNVIEFEYQAGDLTISLNHSYFYKEVNRDGGSYFSGIEPCSIMNSNLFSEFKTSGFIVFPVYLKRITSRNSIIDFTKSQTTERRYLDNHMYSNDIPLSNRFRFHQSVDDFQWAQLDEIKIMDKNNTEYKKFSFTYTNSDNTRLKLLSVEEKSADNIKGKKHGFEYNPNNMSIYLSTQTDHWGFFNNYDVSLFQAQTPLEFINEYSSIREPDQTGESYKYEVLEKITYPTGGYTAFEYELHDYSKIVSKNREQALEIIPDILPAGGLRIKKIISSPNLGYTPITKEYHYNNTLDNPQSFSSGILAGHSEYSWFDYEGIDLDNSSFQYNLFSSNSLTSTGLSSEGSHIGYSVVWETTLGGEGNGIKKYTYTNFDNDIHGNSHLDELPINRVDPVRTIYNPYTSKAIERGKLTSVTDYKVINLNLTKIKEDKYFYQKDSNDFVRFVTAKTLNICSGASAGAQNFYGVAYKKYLFNYNLVKKESTAFDTKGLNPLTSILEYIYNENNLLSEEKMTDSKGDALHTSYTYASDIKESYWPQPSSISSYRRVIQQMDIKNMINYPIEITKSINQNISSELYNYKFYNGTNVKLFSISDLKSPPSENFTTAHFPSGITDPFISDTRYKVSVVYHEYYPNGNIKEFSRDDGTHVVYIWGYHQNLIIAKIVNATYDMIDSYVANLQDLANLDVDNNSENALRNALANLREDSSLSKSQVTTYTHDPIVGVTSITNSRGYTTYYEYDSLGRLEYTRDAKGNIISKSEYNYKNE